MMTQIPNTNQPDLAFEGKIVFLSTIMEGCEKKGYLEVCGWYEAEVMGR